MILKLLSLGIFALCVYLVQESFADPLINQRERECMAWWRHEQVYNFSSPVMKMISRISMNNTVGWKQFTYLQKYPKNFDLAFAVGPDKIIVKAPRWILIMSSVVFERELESDFERALEEEEEGIPLPDLDPEAFKLFVELLILNTWSMDALKALELPAYQLLHLKSICSKYGMTTGLENLTKLVQDFLRQMEKFVKPEDFLFLSQPQLEKILASEELKMNETDIYNYALSWAVEQCRKQKLEKTGENLRNVLGSCLYEIRYPVMSIDEFRTLPQVNELLSFEEIVHIVQYLALGDKYSKSNDTTKLKFKAKRRGLNAVPEGGSIVSVTQIFPVIDTPFICNGYEEGHHLLNMNMKIKLLGVGFLGPIDADAFYNVTVQIKKSPGNTAVSDKMGKGIFAEKSKTFYFIFDQPVVLDPIPHDGWSNFYFIVFWLKGPNTRSLRHNSDTQRIYDGNNEFVIDWGDNQLSDIVYNKV